MLELLSKINYCGEVASCFWVLNPFEIELTEIVCAG